MYSGYIFVAFMAYFLRVTLWAQFRTLAGGTTPRELIDKYKAQQMVDVLLPTTDGRELTLTQYGQPGPEQCMLLEQVRLPLPSQPPPKIGAAQVRSAQPGLAL